LVAYYAGADPVDPMKPGLTRVDNAPYPNANLRPFPRQAGGSGLVSTLPDMVAFIRSLLPGGSTLLKPDTTEQMMSNQLPDDVWIRFAAFGVLQGKGHGLAGALILEPSAFDHQDARGELFWGGRAGTQWWISPETNTAGLIMAQRDQGFAHPFAVEFKRLAYEAVRRKS
jgi:CubicO group peptidase (beta-lactamase class C family)